ncbi:MAG: RNB domain-containing ribonuclease [Verrucomicrobiae bacterium]|nr:RNB domain-containing ribonuclease [Verrucomicrobiae bacterium]
MNHTRAKKEEGRYCTGQFKNSHFFHFVVGEKISSRDDGAVAKHLSSKRSKRHQEGDSRRKKVSGKKTHKKVTSFSKKKNFSQPKRNPLLELENELLTLLKKEALSLEALQQKLSRHHLQKEMVAEALYQLEKERLVLKLRKDHYVLPKNADLLFGTLQVHTSGAAHLLPEEGPDIYISPENLDTGMQGDYVLARLIKDRRARRPTQTKERRAEGEVIRILNRANKTIVGTLQHSQDFSYVIPDNPHLQHNLYLSGDLLGGKPGEKVVASLDRWENRHTQPEGHLLEVLGPMTAPGVDILSIIRKHQLPTKFPPEVLTEASSFEGKVREEDLRDREDLRNRFVITIDPDDARDFDDAIEVQRTSSGWDVTIHIADVSHYVQPQSSLDREAYHRGNSVYLVDRVIPMLPENLSNGLCSLRPNEDRLAFSVFASVLRSGAIKDVRFARTVIRSKARLTYQEALKILEQPPQDQGRTSSKISKIDALPGARSTAEECIREYSTKARTAATPQCAILGDFEKVLAERVHIAWECSSLLRRLRFQQGSLELDMPEVKVRLNREGKVEKLELVQNDISHQLIEELMLLANELVARHLKLAKQPLLYRVHEQPDTEKLNEFRELVSTYQVAVGDLTHRRELQKFLHALHGKPYEHALKIGLLKSLKRARYSPDPLGHYGLQKKDYAHFTSPIRRYADLVVHRALARHLDSRLRGPRSGDLLAIGDHISTTERTAADAEKESIRLKKLDYFEAEQHSRKKHTWKANIIEARNYGLFVELPEVLVSGLVPVSSMDDDFYVFDAPRTRLVGRQTKKIYHAGQQIMVAVAGVDRWKQQIDFRIVSSKK